MKATAERDVLTPADARALNRAGIAIAEAGRSLREIARLEAADSHPRRLTRTALAQLVRASEAIRAIAERHPHLDPDE